MSRKRATVKRNTAAKTKPKKDLTISDDEADVWVKDRGPTKDGCAYCRSDVRESLQALLRAMARNRAFKVTIRELHALVKAKHKGVPDKLRAIEKHLRNCDRDLYDQARGRIS